MEIPQEFKNLSKEDLIKLILTKQKKILKLEERITELEKRLLAYENANTPSSQQRRYPKREKSNNKIGALIGHEGKTREIPKPNNFKELKLKVCPDCGKRLGRPTSIQKRIIEDIPEPRPLKITQFTIPHYFYNYCNKKVIPEDPELPDEGRFGYNLQAQITLMKHEDRLPYRKIANTLNRQYGLKLTAATALDITRRVANKLKNVFEAIKQEIKKAMQANSDETGIKVKGKQFWIQVFVTLTAILYLNKTKQKPKNNKRSAK